MKKTLAFAKRNYLEIVRDALNLVFMLAFPLAILLLLSMLHANIPGAVFPLETLTPGISVFGLSFISLFSGMLIAKDRESALLTRLCASPLTSDQFMAGYILPLIPISMGQTCLCVCASIAIGLPFTPQVLLLPVLLLPAAALFIGIGMLSGTVFNDKQVGGLCGAFLANVCAWLSGAWFDLSLVGGVFEKIAYMLPFAHAVDAGKALLRGDFSQIFPHLLWVFSYAVLAMGSAIWLFNKKMKNAAM